MPWRACDRVLDRMGVPKLSDDDSEKESEEEEQEDACMDGGLSDVIDACMR